MAVHFHKLKIKKVRRETPDCVSVTLAVPDELKQEFAFKEGQNVTLRKEINGEELRRSYSISNAPHEEEIRVAIKQIPGGIFSAYANEHLKAGDEIEVMPPAGRFSARLSGKINSEYLAIAAGSGITPVISIIKHTLNNEPGSRFTLIYGNRTRAGIIFFEELEALKNKYLNRFVLINVLSRERTDSPINYGRIDADKLSMLKHLVPFSQMDAAYICGPEEIIFTGKSFLENNGMEGKNIHFELFTTPGQVQAQTLAATESAVETGPKSDITVKLDGRSFSFQLAHNGRSVLDAALAEGADLPFACKGGVCATCKARVVEGEVRMDTNYALEEEELAEGYVLSCQSHPVSDKITIDFDVK